MKTQAEPNLTARQVDFSIPYFEPIVLGLIAIFYYYLRSHFFEIPMERDEGIYAYYGQLAMEGKTPYLDFYESRLPGIFYMYGILIAIFGSFKGLAVGITILNVGSFLFLYYFAKSWFDEHRPTAFAVASAALLLGLAPEISGFTRQSEHIVVFWATGTLFFLQKALLNNNWKFLLLAGVFSCLAMLTKPNGIFFIVLGGLLVVLYYAQKPQIEGDSENRFKNIIVKGLIYSAGVFGIFGLMCLHMWLKGALADMFYWAVTFSGQYATRIPWTGENGQLGGQDYFMFALKAATKNYLYFWLIAGLGLVLSFFVKNEKNNWYKKIGLLLIAIFSFLTITPSFSFYGHYWLMLVPALALCFGAAFYAVFKLSHSNNMVAWVMAITPAFLLIINITTLNKYYFTARKDIPKVVAGTYGGNPFNEAYEMGKYIKARAKPNDQLILIGSEPQLLIYTGLKSATRHAYFSYLMQDSTMLNIKTWQQEFEQDIINKKPRFIVFFNHDISILANPKANFAWLNNLLTTVIPPLYKPIGYVDLLGTQQVNYVLDENKAAIYQPVQIPNQRTYFAIIFELK